MRKEHRPTKGKRKRKASSAGSTRGRGKSNSKKLKDNTGRTLPMPEAESKVSDSLVPIRRSNRRSAKERISYAELDNPAEELDTAEEEQFRLSDDFVRKIAKDIEIIETDPHQYVRIWVC